MKQVGIGVVGCGAMGMANVRGIVGRDPRIQVVALYDPDQRSIDKAIGELPSKPDVCADHLSLVQRQDVDWVIIASWNCHHSEQVIASFKAGKHVFCQKPLGLNLPECTAMLDAWKQSETLFTIGFTLRYSPHYRKIRKLIESGIVGRIVSMEFNETLDFNHGGLIMGDWRRLRRNAGTHLLEKCCHDIDLANWMVGARAQRVASFGGNNFFTPENQHHIERIGASEDGYPAYSAMRGMVNLNPFTSDKDIVDNQVVILEYTNGVRATFHTNCNAGIPERRMYILGTEGAIRADVLTGSIEVKQIGFETVMEDHSTDSRGGHGGGDDVMAEELLGSMLDRTPPSVGLMEGVEASVTCFAIDDALDTGRVVDLGPYWAKITDQVNA